MRLFNLTGKISCRLNKKLKFEPLLHQKLISVLILWYGLFIIPLIKKVINNFFFLFFLANSKLLWELSKNGAAYLKDSSETDISY